MLTVLTYEQAREHAANALQLRGLAYAAERYQAGDFLKRADGAFEFGRAGEGKILGMVDTIGGVTTNVGAP